METNAFQQIALNTNVSAADRVKSILRAVSQIHAKGPVQVYMRDWRHPYESGWDGVRYAMWFMTGVRILAPMYGVIPRRVEDWLLHAEGRARIMSEEDHRQCGGNLAEHGFWRRERVNSYAKFALNEGHEVVIFNRSDWQQASPLGPEELRLFADVCTIIEPLLAEVRRTGPSEAERARDAEIRTRVTRLNDQLLRGQDFEHAEHLVGEILHAAHSMFAHRGPVLGSVLELFRGGYKEVPKKDQSAAGTTADPAAPRPAVGGGASARIATAQPAQIYKHGLFLLTKCYCGIPNTWLGDALGENRSYNLDSKQIKQIKNWRPDFEERVGNAGKLPRLDEGPSALHQIRPVDPIVITRGGQTVRRWAGISAWVAYHETSLLIEDLKSHQATQPEFNLADWYHAAWKRVRSEIAVPIKDPQGSRLYGVLNLESVVPGLFEAEDVYWLELFAQHAGAIMRRAAKDRVLRNLRLGYNKLDRIAEVIGKALLADAVTIRPLDRPGKAPKGPEFDAVWPPRSSGDVSLHPPARTERTQSEGWSMHILSDPPAFAKDTKVAAAADLTPHPPYWFEVSDRQPPRSEAGDWTSFVPPSTNPSPTERDPIENVYWVRLRRFAEEGETGKSGWVLQRCDRPVNDKLLANKPHCQLWVPLYTPPEEGEELRAPVGILWACWGSWKCGHSAAPADPPAVGGSPGRQLAEQALHPLPTMEEMRSVREIAEGLALLLDVTQILDNSQQIGVRHDMGNILDNAAQHAYDKKLPAFRYLFQYLGQLPVIYRTWINTDPLVRTLTIINGRLWSLRLLLELAYTLTGHYDQFGKHKDKRRLKGGWMLNYGNTSPDDSVDASTEGTTFFALLSILFNLLRNTDSYNQEHYPLDQERERAAEATIWLGDHKPLPGQLFESWGTGRVRKPTRKQPQWLVFAVCNRILADPEHKTDVMRTVKYRMRIGSKRSRRSGLGLIQYLVNVVFRGEFQVETVHAGDKSWIYFVAYLPLATDNASGASQSVRGH